MSVRAASLAGAALAVALVLCACSNSESAVNRRPHTGTESATASDGVQQVTLRVGADFRFHPSTFVVHRGRVRVVLKYVGTGAPHDFQVTQFPGDYVPLTDGGETRSATFMAPSPGDYRFVCTIHTAQGMTGTMIVKP